MTRGCTAWGREEADAALMVVSEYHWLTWLTKMHSVEMRSPGGRGGGLWVRKLLDRLDKGIKKRLPTTHALFEESAELFEQLDTNGDGVVDRDEWERGRKTGEPSYDEMMAYLGRAPGRPGGAP